MIPLKLYSSKINEKFAAPVIIVLGFVVSLWASTIFIVGITQNGYYDGCTTLIVSAAMLTHLLISITCTAGLFHGIKQNDAEFLKPWIGYKIIEGVFMFIGSILVISSYYKPFFGLSLVGIVFLVIGGYITYCVFKTYKTMIAAPIVVREESSSPDLDNVSLSEKPPRYDSFISQINLEQI